MLIFGQVVLILTKHIHINLMHEQIKNIVLENAGSMVALKSALKKHKVEYVKVSRGLKTCYILRSKEIGRMEVIL